MYNIPEVIGRRFIATNQDNGITSAMSGSRVH